MGNMPFFQRSMLVMLLLPALLAGCGGGSGTTPPLVSALTKAPPASTQSTVLADTNPPLAGWDIQTIPEAPPLSLALDAQGRERVSFCGSSGVYYQAQQADNSTRSVWLDPDAACFNALLAVGGDGSNHIVYADTNSDQLKYATDVSGTWVVSVVPGADGAEFPSLAIDQGDAIHVAYLVFTGHSPGSYQLDYASNASGSWQTTLVESVLAYPSIAVDAGGTPHMAYLGAAQAGRYPVHYRSHAAAGWSDETVAISDDPKSLVALAVDPAGNPKLVYKSHMQLEYAEQVSGRWVTAQVDSFDATAPEADHYGAYDVSIDLDTAGNPHLAYEDSRGDLKYAHLNSDRWATLYVDTEGTQNQIRMDAAGRAHITYGNAQNLYSKLAVSP